MRWFKRIAIGAAIVVVLAAIALTSLVVLVDPDHYKAPLAEAVKARYDRTLRIDGKLKLSVFPRLGVDLEKLSLSEPRSTQIFAAVSTARVSVAVWPLLSGRIVVDHVKVSGLKANVMRYQNGQLNFGDLLDGGKNKTSGPQPGTGKASPQMPAETAPLQFDIAGVEFTGGELALRDYMKGISMRVERLSATTGRIAPRTPFNFDVSARILGQSPRVDATVQSQGRFEFDLDAQRFSLKNLDLKAAGVLPSIRATALTGRGDLAFDGKRQSLDASGVSLVFQGDVAGDRPLTGVDARLDAPSLSVGLAEGSLRIEKLSLTSQGKMGADPFDFSLAAPRLLVSASQAQGEAISGRARLSGASDADLRFSLSGVSGNADKFAIEQLAINAELKREARVLRVEGVSPFEASIRHKKLALPKWTGQVTIDDATLPGKRMQIPLTGSVRADLDKEQLSAKLAAMMEGGKLSASVDATQFDEPRISFALAADVLDLDKLMPGKAPARSAGTGGASAGPAADKPVDLSALKGLTANGSVKIGQLVARGVKANDVSATIRVAKGRADIANLKASLYGGSLSGNLFADASSDRIGATPVLSNVSIQPLLMDLAAKDSLMGRGNVSLNLSATGKSVQALQRSLNGTANLSLRDGAVKGINLAQSLREFRSLLTSGEDAGHQHEKALQTDFSEMQAHVVFANGIGTVRKLSVKAPLLRVEQGEPARLDVPAGRLDLQVLVTVVNTATGQDGKDLAELKNLTIPMQVEGPFDSPNYKIQWSKVVGNVLKEKLKDAIEGKLGGAPEQGDKLKDNVRERLKGLFNR